MVAFKISTKTGYYVRPEKIGQYSFPANLNGAFQEGTIYNAQSGNKEITRLKGKFRGQFCLISVRKDSIGEWEVIE